MSDAFEMDVRGLLERRITEAPAALAWSEVELLATDPERVSSPHGGRSAAMVWLAIASVAILAVAAAVLFLRDGSGSVVIDEGPSTTVSEPPEPTIDEQGAATTLADDDRDGVEQPVEPDVASDSDTAAEAPPERVTVVAGDLEVSWVHTTWSSDDGPPTDRFFHVGATPSGLLSVDHEADRVWRWTDSTGWVLVSELDDVSVFYFIDGRDFVIAQGQRRSDGEPVALRSFDGEVWTELDMSAAGMRPITATSPSGLSVLSVHGEARVDAPAVIRSDGVVDVLEAPWPRAGELFSFSEVIDFDGGSVIVRGYDGVDGPYVREAWTYLGDGQFTGPVAVPSDAHIASGPNGTAMTFESEGDEPEFGSPTNLLATTDGARWTVRDSLTAETVGGNVVLGGDRFWIRGPLLRGSSDTIEVRSSVSLSSGGEVWVPLDLPFAGLGKSLEVRGNHIIVWPKSNAREMWVGSVALRESAGDAPDTSLP